MNKPEPITYAASHKTIIVETPDQLIVAQGVPCIDGGMARINGKAQRYMVRYDNKPELAAQITDWLAAWQAYNASIETLADQLMTDKVYNPARAESDLFAWDRFDDTNGGKLLHKPSGRSLYQMRWIDPATGYATDPVTGEERDQAIAFWAALRIRRDRQPAYVAQSDTEPQHGHNGYCRKCHSYCYGDCQAN
jgi:hypothetical protein